MATQTTHRISALIAVTLSFLLFIAVPGGAQTLADAARRERERKKTAHHLHVYTNEDLAKPKILIPDDEARAGRNGMGADSAGEMQVASAAVKDATTTTAILETVTIPVSPNDRKRTAVGVIAATPNIQIIDSYSGPIVVAPEVAATKPSFPAEASGAAPLFTPRGKIALPEVNLPQLTPDAFPLFDASSTMNFPGAPAGHVTSVRAASLDPAPAAPVVTPVNEVPLVIGEASHLLLPLPSEPAATPAVTTRPARTMPTDAPAIPAPLSPVGTPAADVPLKSPVAPPPKSDNPIQLPDRAFENGTGTVTVQRGDSLWKLAERFLGDGQRWPELAKINPQLANPSLIHPGDPIHLPTLPVPAALRSELKTLVVRRGDTLWRVAQAEFGQPLGLHCIAQANQLSSADLIHVGQKLVLPEECGVLK